MNTVVLNLDKLFCKLIMKMYCITINNSHADKIKKLGYTPVGLEITFIIKF